MRELYNKKCGSKGRIFYAHTLFTEGKKMHLPKGEKCPYKGVEIKKGSPP